MSVEKETRMQLRTIIQIIIEGSRKRERVCIIIILNMRL